MHSFSNKNLVMACLLTGIYDVNRSETLADDDYSLVKNWTESLENLQLNGIIFHNSFTDATCKKYGSENITFVKVSHVAHFNPNVYRYFVYRDFLRTHAREIENIFITDISDVVAINNPFIQPLFRENPKAIFCGDEPKSLDNEWMKAHSAHLRTNIADYEAYEKKFSNETLLNCGIIGGKIEVMQGFIEKLCSIHQTYNHDNQTAYTGDMGAFNYLISKQFHEQLLHGEPINTVFKEYQTDRTDCWFRHK